MYRTAEDKILYTSIPIDNSKFGKILIFTRQYLTKTVALRSVSTFWSYIKEQT